MRKFLLTLFGLLVLGLLAACGGSDDSSEQATEEETTETEEQQKEATEEETYQLNVGVTPGPHEEVMEKVAELAKDEGLEIELTVFTDYVIPNVALDEGEIDANSYQHKPFLDNMKEERGLDIVEVANTINFPMGIYSTQVEDVSEIKEGDKLGLPNDPTNAARALLLFQEAGLITLAEGVESTATIHDIEENPLNLEFIELEAAQIPKHLDEVAASVINTNFAIENGYTPAEDAIFLEANDSPWVNVIAVREADKDNPAIQKLIEVYHTDEIKEFIESEYPGSLFPVW